MTHIDENELRPAAPELCTAICDEIQKRGSDLPQWVAVYLVGSGSVALHAGSFVLDVGEARNLHELLRHQLKLEQASMTRSALLLDLQRSKCLIAPITVAMAAVIGCVAKDDVTRAFESR